MKYAVEIGSVAMLHMPSFIKIGPGVKRLLDGHIQYRHMGSVRDCISLLFCQIRELG
jgi:hypothetical protein